MRIVTAPDGTEHWLHEPGDLVRLTRDEDGPDLTARAGDWGRVVRVHRDGSVDLDFAGYSRPRSAALIRATAVRGSRVEPCDAQGRRIARPGGSVWQSRRIR